MQTKEKLFWFIIGLSAIGVGLYPISYSSTVFRRNSLLATKAWELLSSNIYMTAFYTHITWGGIAIITGWSQFIRPWRNNYLKFHRFLGYIYMVAVFISSIAGFGISFFSSGGTVGAIFFGVGAVLWFATNLLAFINIKKGKIREHEKWMMRNYTGTFSAVTLRINLPIVLLCGATIEQALMIVSWLSWVPTVVGMEIYIQSRYDGKLKPREKVKDTLLLVDE